MHGSDDHLIPLTQGISLRQAFGPRVTWVEVEAAGHNDLLGEPQVWQEIAAHQERLYTSHEEATKESQ